MKRKNLLLLLAGVCFSSCTEVTLTPMPEKAVVNLHLEWEGGATPQSAKAYFYPIESTEGTSGLPVFLEGMGNDLTGQMPEGEYRLITYNSDATGVGFDRMNSYGTATVFAQPLAGTRAAETMVAQPSAFYTHSVEEGIVASLLDPLTLTAAPRQLTRSLILKIKLSDVRGVDALTGSLNGVYPSLVLSTAKPAPESVTAAPTVRSSFRIDNPAAETKAYLRTLGILNPEGGKVYHSLLKLVLLGNDGWRQEAEVDLTEVLTDIINKNNNSLPVEVPVEIYLEIKPVGVSLQASVKSWSQGSGSGQIYE